MKNEGMMLLGIEEFEENTEIMTQLITELFDGIIEDIRLKKQYQIYSLEVLQVRKEKANRVM